MCLVNRLEWGLLVLSCALTLFCLRNYCTSWWKTFLGTIICAFPLYFAIERTTQFSTIDELGISARVMGARVLGADDYKDPESRAEFLRRLWKSGAFRTSLALTSPLLATMHIDPAQPAIRTSMTLKAIHFLLGVATLLWIVSLLQQFSGREPGVSSFCLLFCGALLLPSNLMALKTFNYDLLSLTLGMIAVLYACLAIRDSSGRPACYAVLLAYLAAQEKLISSPILIAALVVFVFVQLRKRGTVRTLRPILHCTLVLTACLVIGTLSGFACQVLPGMPRMTITELLSDAVMPFVTWTWPLVRFLGGVSNLDALEKYGWWLLGPSLACCLAAGYVLALVPWEKFAPAVRAGLLAVIGATGFAVAMGVFGNYAVDPCWAPFEPIAAEAYHPPGHLNGVSLHFHARSFAGHLLNYTGFAYSVYLNAIPSAYWLLAALTLGCWGFAPKRPDFDPRLQIVVIACLVAPALFALAQIPIGNRYINLFLALSTMIIGGMACHLMAEWSPRTRYLVTAAVLGCMMLEVAPFRPFFAPFRPMWVSYRDPHVPRAGHLNPSWVGWGEEVMLTGEALVNHSSASATPTVYSCYPGAWFTTNPRAHIRILDSSTSPTDLRYDRDSYYLLSRSSVVQGVRFPEQVTPTLALSYRGFDMAWLFQGTTLRAAGYRFDPASFQFVRTEK
jgi:hypothetical protein